MARQKIAAIKEGLLEEGISGRFAEWEYYNMDKAIEAAMDCVNNIEEMTLISNLKS
ncbi:MAG: hypothetical protein M3512_06310 [Bacteroidota bacterium]|nr:hypothetical protein [Bacteroidota bacterium]